MMNELPLNTPASLSNSRSPAMQAKIPGSIGRLVYILLAAFALLLVAQWWTTRAEIRHLRREVAQRLQAGDTFNNETKSMARSVQEGMKEL
jgi:hypothetical protein